jgi:putative colanic acid biosynthesis acetyltransferase WcaF
MNLQLDIAANRAARNYSHREKLLRVLWIVGSVFFRLSPRSCFAWRRWLLASFGAKIGRYVNVHPSSRIYFPWNLQVGDWSAIGEEVLIYNLGPIVIGQKVTISRGAHLCAGTHEYQRVNLPLLKPPIEVRSQAWICADAFIGPGVVIGDGAVVGARAVITKDVTAWTVIAGNPARKIGSRKLLPAS